jgi:3-deoxy-D-manno-octulosonic-acid transferase
VTALRRRVRRALQSPRLRRALCWAIHLYIRLVFATNRWTVEGGEVPHRLRAEGRSFILAFWHGRLLMIPMAWQRLAPMHMLISAHRDGRIIADAVAYFGVASIDGSSRRGGTAALRLMVKRLQEGDCVGITPDGPHGPAMTATPGIVNLARLGQAPILPIVFAASRCRVLKTWDRFHLALPFGRGVFLWGEPIEVAGDLDAAGVEAATRLVENRMNEMAREADRRVEGRWWPAVYRALTAAAAPLVRRYLDRRCRRGKEDPERLGERLGIASLPRPPGPLVWLHAASVGEAASLLALIERLVAERPALEILLTTGTVAAAQFVGDRLPRHARQQYVPVDLPGAVERFLAHWRPDLAIWVESELWPNLVLATARRETPLLLVNARLSVRSLARWRRLPRLIRPVIRAFDLVLAQDGVQAERYRRLGASPVAVAGDLKSAAPPLAADPAALAALRAEIGERPVWLAASTHPGEEEIAAAAHLRIARDHPGLLTIIAPRHPVRGAAIEAMLRARGLAVARRSASAAIRPDTDIYLADTLGEMGLFFRLAGIAFIGGSLVGKGGHNPFEAARLDCAVLHGPDMANCAAMAGPLDKAGAALTVGDAAELAAAVTRLLADPAERTARAASAAQVAASGGGALDAVLQRLAPWLDRLAPVVREEEVAPREPADARA